MPAPISSIAPASLPAAVHPPIAAGTGGEFQRILEGAVQTIQATQSQATQAVQQFLSGQSEELHSTAIATQRAELVFELALQVRNKVVQAYQEIMRMQM